MRILTIIALLAAALSAGYLGSRINRPAATQQAAQESTYDRVMRTGTIRCGYFVWPPFVSKDTNSGAFSGISYDMVNALANAAGLKTEWSTELAFSTYLQDVANGRVDAECGDGWPNAVRGKFVFYSKPYAYVPIVAVVRDDDARFDTDPALLNNPQITVVAADGETSSIIANARMPNAKRLTLPQTAGASDQMLNVAEGKADVALTDTLSAYNYIKANPGKVKMIRYAQPLHLIGLGSTLPQDPKMKALFDTATDQLIANGTIEAILQKYEPEPGLIWRTNKAYSRTERSLNP